MSKERGSKTEHIGDLIHLPKMDPRIQDALAMENEEAWTAKSIGYMARLLVQVTIPHRKLTVNEFERKNGSISVLMMAPSAIGLPYGTYPRLLISWITTEALRTQVALAKESRLFDRPVDAVPIPGGVEVDVLGQPSFRRHT